MNFINKHKYFLLGVVILIGGILTVAVVERQRVFSNTTESALENPARTGESLVSGFYYEQLNEREKAVYDQLAACMEEKKGGVVTLVQPINGKEYTRICNALEYDQKDYFYGLVDLPMTADNRYLLYEENKKPMDIVKAEIEKCVVFLYCAKGIDEKGSYDDAGYVENIEKLEETLGANDPERLKEIEKMDADREQILSRIIAEIPAAYGQKETVDYFLDWIGKNLTFDAAEYENLGNVTSMRGLFEQVYFRSGTACVSGGKALAAGFNKVLMNLCNRAGMESHVVFGIWNREETGYVLTSVRIGEQTVYVDAAGIYSSSLGGQRYLREEEAVKHLSFVDYFEYKRD